MAAWRLGVEFGGRVQVACAGVQFDASPGEQDERRPTDRRRLQKAAVDRILSFSFSDPLQQKWVPRVELFALTRLGNISFQIFTPRPLHLHCCKTTSSCAQCYGNGCSPSPTRHQGCPEGHLTSILYRLQNRQVSISSPQQNFPPFRPPWGSNKVNKSEKSHKYFFFQLCCLPTVGVTPPRAYDEFFYFLFYFFVPQKHLWRNRTCVLGGREKV